MVPKILSVLHKNLKGGHENLTVKFIYILFPFILNGLLASISINLYNLNGNSIQPYLTCSHDEKKSDHVNLLLIEDEAISHYVYIKCLPKLVRDQLSKHEHHHFICERCFYHTENIERFRRHHTLCDNYFDN